MKAKLESYQNIYFIGIGGIGMSALARYFNFKKFRVAGYDKTPSALTNTLIAEGIEIHFEDLGENIDPSFLNPSETLVIYTPAIPKNHGELNYFKQHHFTLLKRAEVLGLITRSSKGLGVAGTHGKTTTSSLLTHILSESHAKCNAFLGGISANFNSNFISDENSEYTVIEADEFDRSFLQLTPFGSIITSTDADHLDIYGDATSFLNGFQTYANQIQSDGILVMRKGLKLSSNAPILTYAIEEDADLIGKNLRAENGTFLMDVESSEIQWKNVALGLPGIHNAENALACIGFCLFLGLSENEIRNGLATFKGVKRRFEYQLKSSKLIYIDDYAHHPTEIQALISSVKLLYPTLKIYGAFQPHLFSRTRDFLAGFAEELSKLDALVLLPIYPAREEPIAGITSEALLELCTNVEKMVLPPNEAINWLAAQTEGVILTIGAGDIDRIVEPLKMQLIQTNKA
jgi:UDP-N-acetylmuramate--alanine ligase